MQAKAKTVMLLAAGFMLTGCAATQGWKATLADRLPVYGHRNWIVVADSAYPRQSADGIETIHTQAGQVDTLRYVLRAIEKAPHVNPVVYIDREMAHVAEADAPGLETYRNQLTALLKGRNVNKMPHEEIIGMLDTDAETFNILILKTDMTIPYTSVFFKLDCGYWDAERERTLRDSLNIEL